MYDCSVQYASLTYKFTGKERDTESGLDNFTARYFTSSMGRFMSPDPYNAGAFLDGPQTWNAYSYVVNNPLNAIDPNGLDCVYLNEGGDKVQEVKSGDCRSETDNGYYVNGTIQGGVNGVGLTPDNNTIVYSYTNEDQPGTQYGHQCVGDCSGPDYTVTVSSAPPGTPTMSAAPYPGTLIPPPQITFQPPTTFWQRLAVAAGCTLGLDAELMAPVEAPTNGNDRPEESKLTEGKYKVPFRTGTPGRPPEMNKSGKQSAKAMNAAAGGAALVGNQQACLQNASGQR
jgi:RHS repeat-associated protein